MSDIRGRVLTSTPLTGRARSSGLRARARTCLAAAFAALVLVAGCAPKEAAPEVGPAAEASGSGAVDESGSDTGTKSGADSTDGGATTGDGSEGTDGSAGEAGEDASAQLGPGADSPVDRAPSVSLPSLPIGGNAAEPDAAGVQCADVNWRGEAGTPADLVAGVRVVVTGVVFAPAVFTLVDGACGSGLPSCTGFVFQSAARQCSVAVASSPDAADPGGPYYFQLSGRVECPGLDGRSCAAFAEAAAAVQDQSIELNAPATPADTGTTGGESGTGTTGGETGSGSGDGGSGSVSDQETSTTDSDVSPSTG